MTSLILADLNHCRKYQCCPYRCTALLAVLPLQKHDAVAANHLIIMTNKAMI
jgi:hypothetical protein